MVAHRTEMTVGHDHAVTIQGLPFDEGQQVEVIVLPKQTPAKPNGDWRALRGSVIRYDHPVDPTSEDEWEALK